MAVSQAQLTELYLSYFGRPPDFDGLVYYTSNPAFTIWTVAAGFSASPESQALYGTSFNATQINAIYQNLFNRDAEPAGLLYWSQEVAAGRLTPAGAAYAIMLGAQNDDLVAVQNKLQISAAFVTALDTAPEIIGYTGTVAAASARAFLATVDSTAGSLTTATAGLDAAVAAAVGVGGAVGSSFALTATVDSLTGTGNNDIFTGVLSDTAATTTYNTGDSVNGSGGNDTFRIIASDNTYQSNILSIKSVEKVEIQNASGSSLTLDATNWSGVSEYNLTNSNDYVYLENIAEDFSKVGISNFGSGGTANYNFDLTVANGVFDGNNDTVTVTLNKAGSNLEGEYADLYIQNDDSDNVVENLVVNSVTSKAGDDNYLYYNNSADVLKTLTVTGAAGVAFALDSYNALTKIDASGATGKVDFWSQDSIHVEKAFTYTGSQGTDLIAIHDDSSTGVAITVNTGAGDDTVELDGAPGTNTKFSINLGVGDDRLLGTSSSYAPSATGTAIDGGDGTDTVGVALVNVGNSTVFKNFEILDIAGINSTTTFDASIMSGSTFTGVAVTGELGADATVTGVGFASGLTVTGDPDGADLTVTFAATTGTTDALNVVFNDSEEGSDNYLAFDVLKVNGIETFNIASGGSDEDDENEINVLSSNTVTTVNVTGENDFNLWGIANVTATGLTSFTKLDASTATGDNEFVISDLLAYNLKRAFNIKGSAWMRTALQG